MSDPDEPEEDRVLRRMLLLGLPSSLGIAPLFACTSTPPPPPDVASPPARIVPRLVQTPASPPPGQGLVVFDSVSGPVEVRRITEHSSQFFDGVVVGGTSAGVWYGVSRGHAEGTTSVLLCSSTPCAAYLPYGDHEVLLSSLTEDRHATYEVSASDKPRVFRASPDLHIPPSPTRIAGIAGLGVGLTGALVGALLLGPLSDNSNGRPQSGSNTAGYVMIGGGLLMAAAGAVLFSLGHSDADYQGRASEWLLPAPSASK